MKGRWGAITVAMAIVPAVLLTVPAMRAEHHRPPLKEAEGAGRSGSKVKQERTALTARSASPTASRHLRVVPMDPTAAPELSAASEGAVLARLSVALDQAISSLPDASAWKVGLMSARAHLAAAVAPPRE